MLLGWFSRKHCIAYTLHGCDGNGFCIYEKSSGDLAVITSAQDHSESWPAHEDDAKFMGEITKVVISKHQVNLIERLYQLDLTKLRRAFEEVEAADILEATINGTIGIMKISDVQKKFAIPKTKTIRLREIYDKLRDSRVLGILKELKNSNE